MRREAWLTRAGSFRVTGSSLRRETDTERRETEREMVRSVLGVVGGIEMQRVSWRMLGRSSAWSWRGDSFPGWVWGDRDCIVSWLVLCL